MILVFWLIKSILLNAASLMNDILSKGISIIF